MAVLFGVFLYMGISSIDGVQFFERLKLFLMPVKHHSQATYVRRVRMMIVIYFSRLMPHQLMLPGSVLLVRKWNSLLFHMPPYFPFSGSLKDIDVFAVEKFSISHCIDLHEIETELD